MYALIGIALVSLSVSGLTERPDGRRDVLDALATGDISAVAATLPEFEPSIDGAPRSAVVRIAACDGLFGFSTIQSAIDASADGDVVVVLPNHCNESNRWHEKIDFHGKSIRLQSANPADPVIVAATILDGNSTGTAVQSLATPPAMPSIEIDGFTFADCYRALNLSSTNALLDRCRMTATKFTALSITGSPETPPAVSIRRTTFDDNPANKLINALHASLSFSDCSFRRNHSGQNATLMFANCEVELTDCLLSENGQSPTGFGLIAWLGGPRLEVSRCRFEANSGTQASCLWIAGADDQPVLISDCLFVANRSTAYGGAIRNLSSNAVIKSCTLTGNLGAKSGAIYSNQPSLTLTGCIVRSNRAVEPDNLLSNQLSGFLENIHYCNVEGLAKDNPSNFDSPAQFVSDGFWQDNGTPTTSDDTFVAGDYHLLPDSPCINAADPGIVAAADIEDLDHQPRVMDCRLDMGAFESAGALLNSGDYDADGLITPADIAPFVASLLHPTNLDCVTDLNADGVRDAKDLIVFVDELLP